MSVQSEIQRLQTAKEDILEAISKKNIVIPSDIKLDGIPSLIDKIENAKTNNLFWQEILNGNEYEFLTSNTNDIHHIPQDGMGVLSSQDGITYTRNQGYGNCAAVLGNTVIGYLDSDYCYDISFDNGINWEYWQFVDFGPIYRIIPFANKFILFTVNGEIYSSTNGLDWEHNANDGFAVTRVCATPSFIIAGSDDGVYYSNDGDVWINTELVVDDFLSEIVFDGERYYVLCYKKFYHSTDLLNWSEEIVNLSGDTEVITGIIHYYWSTGGHGWVLTSTGGVYWCSDIITTTSVHSWQKYFDGLVCGIASRINRAMIVTDKKIYTSTNLVDWYECTPTNLTNPYLDNHSVICDGTSFYIFGVGLLKAT